MNEQHFVNNMLRWLEVVNVGKRQYHLNKLTKIYLDNSNILDRMKNKSDSSKF